MPPYAIPVGTFTFRQLQLALDMPFDKRPFLKRRRISENRLLATSANAVWFVGRLTRVGMCITKHMLVRCYGGQN